MSGKFLRELKRRHVYRVAVVYVVVGWLLIQVATQVFPYFHIPDWSVRLLVLLVLAGFPVALVLAWAFDATPHGIERTASDGQPVLRRARHGTLPVAVVGVLIAVLAGAGYWWWHRAPRAVPTTAVTAPTAPTGPSAPAASAIAVVPAGTPRAADSVDIPAKSIAVLPFENLSTDKGNAYFADGMQDLILTKLADIGDLKVISRTSTEQYGSHPGNLKTIARQLGVATILEGSVQKAGKQVLINVQLIDAKTDAHIWAQSYTRTLDNIFGVEGEVAQKVADALNAKLTPVEATAIARIPTQNKAAYDLGLKAIYYLDDSNRTLDRSELERSAALAQQAVRLDPNFADAYTTLALAYIKLGGHPDDAESAAKRALALDPGNADAHRMFAYVLRRKGEIADALVQAREAVRLRPNAAQEHSGLGNVYVAAGRFSDAAVEYKRAIEIDPRANFYQIALAGVQTSEHRYTDARDTLQGATSNDPTDLRAATQLAAIYWLGWGDLDAARKVLQAVPTPVASSGALSYAWYRQELYARDYAAALDVIAKAPVAWFTQEPYPRELFQAQVYQAQGDAVKARTAFLAVRAQLEARIKSTPGGAALHANLALTLAGLGENDQALREAQHAVALDPVAKDAIYGAHLLIALAQVNARIGNTDAAIKLLGQLLAIPAGEYISVPLLKLDPTWDPIRKDPRFQALLKKYAHAEPAPASSEVGHD